VFKPLFLSGFQELYARQACQDKRSAVIRLNLVRLVNKILDVLDDELLRIRLCPLRRVQCDLEEYLSLVEATATPKLLRQRNQHQRRLGETMELIIVSRDDIATLWRDDDVRTKLETHQTLLSEHSRL
jgi:hypothetical protein